MSFPLKHEVIYLSLETFFGKNTSRIWKSVIDYLSHFLRFTCPNKSRWKSPRTMISFLLFQAYWKMLLRIIWILRHPFETLRQQTGALRVLSCALVLQSGWTTTQELSVSSVELVSLEWCLLYLLSSSFDVLRNVLVAASTLNVNVKLDLLACAVVSRNYFLRQIGSPS